MDEELELLIDKTLSVAFLRRDGGCGCCDRTAYREDYHECGFCWADAPGNDPIKHYEDCAYHLAVKIRDRG